MSTLKGKHTTKSDEILMFDYLNKVCPLICIIDLLLQYMVHLIVD